MACQGKKYKLVQLIRATDKAEADGIPEGFRFLVTECMHLVETANLYLYKTCVKSGRVESSDTQKTYAEGLYDWFQTCEDMDWDWDDITDQEISMYRNRMLNNLSPHTGLPYKRTTINARLGIIYRFYQWACSQNLLDELPFSYTQVRVARNHDSNAMAHVERNAGQATVNILKLKTQQTEAQAIALPDLRRILHKLGPARMNDPSDPRPIRDRLFTETAVVTGLRRLEIAGLTVNQIPETDAQEIRSDLLSQVRLTITKGSKPRMVILPQEMINRLNWYIRLERAKIVYEAKKVAKRNSKTYREPSALFLNQDGSPISRSRITRIFKSAAEEAGVPNANFHSLRHTFAITMYKAIKRHDPEPWKALQILLGHAHLSTTMNTYLNAVEVDEALVTDSVEALYNEVLYGSAQ